MSMDEAAFFSKRGSCSSLSPNYISIKPRNSNSSSYGTMPRKTKLKRMDSQEKVNQITRFLLLNEEGELFKDSPAASRRISTSGGSPSPRKLSMDAFISGNWITDGKGTLKKSLTSLSLQSPIPQVIKKRKDRKKSLGTPAHSPASPEAPSEISSADQESVTSYASSVTSAASDVTLRAEPAQKVPKFVKNYQQQRRITPVNNELGKNDTVTYRRQRRVGVHFSQSIRINRSSSDV